jgi:hypothetical protein
MTPGRKATTPLIYALIATRFNFNYPKKNNNHSAIFTFTELNATHFSDEDGLTTGTEAAA